jgi:hypothetical protein
MACKQLNEVERGIDEPSRRLWGVQRARALLLWHLPGVGWPVADRLIGVVKTVRVWNAKRVAVQKREGQPRKEEQPAPIVSTNFHATNVDMGAIPPRFIHTVCDLKQPSVRQSCALALLKMIRVLARTLAMDYYFAGGPAIPAGFRPALA